jgi:hypothetical protein
VREFFNLELLSAGQWFLSLISVAVGLVLAAVAWRLPYIQELEAPAEGAGDTKAPESTGPATEEHPLPGRGPSSPATEEHPAPQPGSTADAGPGAEA